MPIFLLLCFFSFSLVAQDFRPPINIPLFLAGSFGELRGGHFHAGMDIKTEGKIGQPVYAVADGYVSRIKVSATGYGNALYIDHPNGYTSVYGHLSQYNPVIAAFAKRLQYAKESFEIDTMLAPNVLPVKKGELIALSGSTGSSEAPHLHFEIRRQKDQEPVNPMCMSFVLKDHIPPDITALYVYALDSNLSETPYPVKVQKIGRKYSVKDTIRVNANSIGLAVQSFDRMDADNNHLDVYQLVVKAAGKIIYRYSLDSFAFDDTRYVQAHEDYGMKVQSKRTVNRLWRLPGNFIHIYDSLVNNGIITLTGNKAVPIEIIARDAAGNTSTLSFVLEKSNAVQVFKSVPPNKDPLFRYNQENRFKTNDVEVIIPDKNLYRNIHFHYSKRASVQPGIYSELHSIHYDTEPINRHYKLAIAAINFPARLKDKAVMVYKNHSGGVGAYNGKWNNNNLTAEVREFGLYYIGADTVPPVIRPVNIVEGKDMSLQKEIIVKIGDALSGVKNYRGTIDGKWVLMEFDAKSGTLTHTFEKNLKSGEHTFGLVVEDNVGNKNELKLDFKK